MTEKLDIVQLIQTSPITCLSEEYQHKLVEKIQQTFTESQQQLFIASFYTYLNYNKNDFVIELENIWKWLGFARIDPAKRVIEKNFVINIDYKIVFHQPVENLKGGRPKEKILMNINTFKKLCLKSDTKKADEIHDYFIKLEETLQEVIAEESNELKQQLQIKDQLIQQFENKPELEGFIRQDGYIYLISDISKKCHYKIGFAENPTKRLSQLNTGSSTYSLQLLARFKTIDKIFAEKLIHYALFPFKIAKAKEWFYFANDLELAYSINTIKSCVKYIEQYDIKDHTCFKEFNKNLDIQTELQEINTEIDFAELEKKELEEIKLQTIKLQAQQFTNKTGLYKGVWWNKEKEKWQAGLKKNYKEIFLGYYDTELDGAKVYNEYAQFLNETENSNYLLNEIPDFQAKSRDVLSENKQLLLETKTSKFTGVDFIKTRQHYKAAIKYKGKSFALGQHSDETECAKLYNQQAMYYNQTLGTKYILNEIPEFITTPRDIHSENKEKYAQKKSSKYFGVTFDKTRNKYKALLVYNKKQLHLGTFENELDAVKVYNTKADELNKQLNKIVYKLN